MYPYWHLHVSHQSCISTTKNSVVRCQKNRTIEYTVLVILLCIETALKRMKFLCTNTAQCIYRVWTENSVTLRDVDSRQLSVLLVIKRFAFDLAELSVNVTWRWSSFLKYWRMRYCWALQPVSPPPLPSCAALPPPRQCLPPRTVEHTHAFKSPIITTYPVEIWAAALKCWSCL